MRQMRALPTFFFLAIRLRQPTLFTLTVSRQRTCEKTPGVNAPLSAAQQPAVAATSEEMAEIRAAARS
jgi:hypothetical protein